MPSDLTPPFDPPIPSAPSRLVEMNCIICGYSLNGLGADAKCPECGTPIERSLRPSTLSYLGLKDASLLSRGLTKLRSSVWIFSFNVVMLFLVALTGGVAAYVALPCGVISLPFGVLLWLLGWHQVARIGADGAGAFAAPVKAGTVGLAWTQTTAALWVIASLLGMGSGRADRPELLAFPLAPLLMLGIGHWRLRSLALRDGTTGLSEGARDSTRSVVISIGLWITALATAVFESTVALALAGFGAIFSIAAIIGWHAFLWSMQEEAQKR